MDENKKEHHLHIVLTTQQYQLLCCQAKECRLTKRAYLARLIEGRPVKARPKGGLHVLRQLQERGHRLSTILMTVLPTQKIVRDATELGAAYVFPKPFSSQAMIEKIQELLKRAPPTKH